MGTNGGNELVRRAETTPASIDHGTAQSDAMGTAMERAAEAGTAQLEAQARALVQARFYVAKQPHMMRSWDQVEQRLRKECARPGFAQSAWWILPIGGDPNKYPKGLSIRFAEAALRLAGNIDVQQQTVFDDAWKRIVRITVMDLETNFAYTSEITIDKTVERSNPKDREVLSVRQNSAGKMSYVVAATEQELALKQGSAVSKAIRTQGLRLVPGDILDECKALIVATRAKGAAAEDPEQARKAILDSFAELGVMPADLARYLEHDTNSFQPAERDALRGIYTAIKNGMGTWRDVMDAKFGSAEPVEESSGAKKVKEALAKRKTAPVSTPAPAAPEPEAAPTPPPTPQPKPAPAPAAALKPPSHLEDKTEWPDPEDPANEPWIKYQGKLYHNASGQIGGYREWVAPEKPKAPKQERFI